MAALSAIRTAIKTTIEGNIAGLKVLPKVIENPPLPCVVCQLETGEFITFGRGFRLWPFTLDVIVPCADLEVAQTALDAYVDGFGAQSIEQVVFNNPTLGLTNVNATIAGMLDYGFVFQAVTVEHLGARLSLGVRSPGTS
jgi:hypothetical protein